jgi:hypothetical protein
MGPTLRRSAALLVVPAILLATGASIAQETGEATDPAEPTEAAQAAEAAETEDSRPSPIERGGDLMIDLGTWIAQPAGLDYQPAIATGIDQLSRTELLEHEHGTETEERWMVGFYLPDDIGLIDVGYFAHRTVSELERYRPGEPFAFITLWAHPPFAGVNNDARADGFYSRAETVLRDTRLRFSRPMFDSGRIEGRWSIGWRRVAHQRVASARYFAISPDLPPIASDTPRPDLIPGVDVGELESRFEGRGPDVGLDVDFDLWKDRLTLETELSFAVLRGKINHLYRSVTWSYLEAGIPIDPPYDDAFATPDDVVQASTQVDLRGDSLSTSSQAIDAQIGFRYKVFDWLHAQGGFRSARYDDVGTDLRPESSTFWVYTGLEETDRSVTYEGFYASVTFFVF